MLGTSLLVFTTAPEVGIHGPSSQASTLGPEGEASRPRSDLTPTCLCSYHYLSLKGSALCDFSRPVYINVPRYSQEPWQEDTQKPLVRLWAWQPSLGTSLVEVAPSLLHE